MIQMNSLVKQKNTDFENYIMIAGGRDSRGVWDGHIHTAIFKMDNQQGPTVQHMKLCSILCGSLDGNRVWGRMDPCIYMAESLHCLHEIITTLLIDYIPIQDQKLKKKKKTGFSL